MEYIYHCKKNGLDYVYATAIEFALPQDGYAWRRGVREYADNYHASETLKKHGDVEALRATVTSLCDEALMRFNAGDVPGERGVADPKTVEVRKMANAIREAGITMAQFEAAMAEVKKAKEVITELDEKSTQHVERQRKRA